MLKRLFLILGMIQSYVYGQYIPFPLDNAVWVNHEYNVDDWWPYWTLVSIDNFCVNNQDTVINSVTYTQLHYCDGNYRGALRDNSGQVFFVSKDSASEMLLYDFTVDIDDTLTDIYLSYYWFDTLFVSDISSITIGGQIHKTIFLEDESHNDLPDYWIEGVGCSAGLLIDPFSNMNVSGWYNEFACFSRNDSIFNPQTNFYYQGSGSCHLNYMEVENLDSNKLILYPNPAEEILKIQLPAYSGIAEISVFNALGELVFEHILENSETPLEIPLQSWEGGIYIVRLQTSSGVYSARFVKR